MEGVRKTRTVCDCHESDAFAPFSTSLTPAETLFAGENDSSIKASRTSSPPRSRRSLLQRKENILKYSFFRPLLVPAVAGLLWRIPAGDVLPGAPVRRTHRMPLSSSCGLRRERPCGSDRLDCDGIKGSKRFHCSSVKSIWIHKTRSPQMSRLF